MNETKKREIEMTNCLFIHRHGTRCAGEVGKCLFKKIDEYYERIMSCLAAAANNNICNVGVAYNARIGGK